MNLHLIPLSHEQLEWKETIPFSFKGVRLPGSTVLSSVGEFGSICTQEFKTDNFFLRLNVFDLLQRFVAGSLTQMPGLFARLVIKGRTDLQLNNDSIIPLRQNQFLLFRQTDNLKTETYEKNIHLVFDTFLSEDLSKELKQVFPQTNYQALPRWSDAEITTTVHSVLRCKYENELRRHFFESRVKDIFFKYFSLSSGEANIEIIATNDELKAIYKAEEIISSNIDRHYSIPELSKKILLNEYRLKLLFKKVFGTGPYEFLVNKRLEKGMELLETGLSVKEVAAKVGYRPSDFTTAFRNHFGFPPSDARKKI